MDCLNKNEVTRLIDQEKCKYKYVWVNTYSDIYVRNIIDIGNIIDFLNDNLIEAKFFNNEGELSIMTINEGQNFSVVNFNPEEYEDFIEESQILNKYISKNQIYKLKIRHYLKYDEDGQAYVAYTKLCSIEEDK